jgi:streptomycin 6-kinase
MTDALHLPEDFRARLRGYFPDKADAWFDALPSLIDEYEQRWGIVLEAPFPLSIGYVAPARRRDGTRAVFKAVVANHEVDSEIAALRAYGGEGAVALLESDAERGVMLLERADPGDPLLSIDDDDERTLIAADVMRPILRPAPEGRSFRDITYWAKAFTRLRERFDGGTGPLPAALVDRAESILHQLYPPASPGVLLHGDLHHGNILRATRAPWLVIDPKGIIGPTEYEPAQLFTNPWKDYAQLDDLLRWIPRRLDILSERLGMDRRQVAAWGLHKAVLSSVWTVEAGGDDFGWALAVAERLALKF